jgi:septation ring formation regulator EzrA
VATPEDIESRLSAVEREVVQLREQTALAAVDASAARTLSAGADQDVSEVRAELRAHTSALNALRQTQLEQGQRLDRLETRVEAGFAATDASFARADAAFARTDASFATVHAGMAHIVSLLEELTGRNSS